MTVVKMRVSLVGPTLSVSGGDLFECDEATAARLVANGAAEWVAGPVPETAMRAPIAEHAVKAKPRARG